MKQQQFQQQGFTIIELMVSMALSVFILAALSTLFFNSASVSKSEGQRQTMRDNARVALEQIAQVVRHAGYRGVGGANLETGFWIDTPGDGQCADGGSGFHEDFMSVYGSSALRNFEYKDNAVLGVVYVGDKRLNTDAVGQKLREECWFGSAVGINASLIHSEFYVQSGSLLTRTSLSLSDGGIARGYEVASDVKSFHVLYGVDTDSDQAVDQYMTAADVDAGDHWGQVLAVEMALMMRSQMPVLTSKQQRTYKVLNKQVQVNDMHAYDVYTKTVKIRNATL